MRIISARGVTILFCIGLAFSQTKPNLLVIITDQQRFDAMGRYQLELGVPLQSRIKTPNLDRLSQEGAYFRNAYTQCAVCGPSRTSLLTGRTIEHTGVRTNWLALEANLNVAGNDAAQKVPLLRTYDEILARDFGYAAEYYGKWHSPETRGCVYGNDVRMAGEASAWFCKYAADGTTKHFSIGLEADFLGWLDSSKISKTAPTRDQQTGTWTERSYVPDPLDSRYGLAPGATETVQPNQHGRDLVPDGYSVTAREGTEALEALGRLSKSGKPFSLTVSFHFPHSPMVPTAKYYNMYNPDNLITPASIRDPLTNSAYAKANSRNSIGPGYQDSAKVRRWMANYYGLVSEIDEWVGSILAKVDSLGIQKNTLIVFTSDHGEMLGSHGLREKNIFYEESAHIPLLLRMPGKIPAGTVVDGPVTLIDLRATCLDYLGAGGNYPSDGASLRRCIEGADSGDSYIVTEWNYTDTRAPRAAGSEPAFLIRKGSWKLIIPNTASSAVLDMLFNLAGDPCEMNNLAGKNGATASDYAIGKAEYLKALLVEYLANMSHPALSEVRARRTWKTVNLWISDTAIDFGSVRPGHSITRTLYLGRTTTGTTTISGISISGSNADRFGIDWTGGTINAGASKAVHITYRDPGSAAVAGNARLTIQHNAGGAAKSVTLIPPQPVAARNDRGMRHATSRAFEPASVSCRGNVLYVNNTGNNSWSVRVQDLSGRTLREFGGRGASVLPCRPSPGTYVVRIKTGGVLRSGMIAVVY